MVLEARDQCTVHFVALGTGCIDIAQNRPHRVDHGQEISGDLGRQFDLAVAQPSEQGFADMGNGFEGTKGEETTRALDGVDGAKDPPKDLPVRGVLLEVHQVLIELVEVFDALGQKLCDDGIHPTHEVSPPSPDSDRGPLTQLRPHIKDNSSKPTANRR